MTTSKGDEPSERQAASDEADNALWLKRMSGTPSGLLRLAKPHVDIGLYTEHFDAHRSFWEGTLRLHYEGYQKLGGGVRQHRYGLNGSVLKVNHARDALANAPTGLRRLIVTTDIVERPVDLTDPDGTPVRLVPPDGDGGVSMVVEVAVAELDATRRWWVEGVGGMDIGGGGVRIGETVVALVEEPGRAPTSVQKAVGLRYLTVQVHDVVAEHARLVDFGSDAPMDPTRLGDTAVISFVRSPDGDWLELSQRADLTGPLPDL